MSIDLDAAKVLELPPGAATHFRGHRPWTDQRSIPAVDFVAGKPTTVTMQPFEVIELELVPVKN